ncbi:MAG: hypothetical protein KF830_02970 [Planctomycetes bacterium]|nr:hypothetical protein [Planctomycetota bacterium]
MRYRLLSAALVATFLSGCATPPTAPAPAAPTPAAAPSDPAAAAAKAAAEAKQQQDQKRDKQKTLRHKQQELAHAKVEVQLHEIERRSRLLAVESTLERTAADLEVARRELEVFLQDVRPREIESRRISLDGSVYHAEHSKEELAELTAMYEADEFARTTKELVLKRGRRSMEMAERRLAVERREFAHYEQFELPKRERDLRHKLADAELARKRAEFDADKARLELDMGGRKLTERIAELETEIRELQEALAGESA